LDKLRVGKALPSIVALACGMNKDHTINAIGTGFGVGTSVIDENITLLATCTHVADDIFQINKIKEHEGKQKGLIDNYTRAAFFLDGKFQWKKIEVDFIDAKEIGNELGFSEIHDACILRVSGIKIPSLPFFKSSLRLGDDHISYEIGSEVMIIGFPIFDEFPTNSIMPYILKTIISSSMPFSFNRSGKNFSSPRLALGCIVGGGFSGSPVISIEDGSVVGMIDYTPFETSVIDVKLNKPSQIEGNVRLEYPAGITFAIPSMIINRNLDFILDWERKSKSLER
jgi:hypothetical protein